MCRFCAAPSTCDSALPDENATEPPSGESDGIASFPATVVTGTRRNGLSRRAPPRSSCPVPGRPRFLWAIVRVCERRRASGTRGLPSNPLLTSRSSTFTSAMCCTRRDTLFPAARISRSRSLGKSASRARSGPSVRRAQRRRASFVVESLRRMRGRRHHLVEDRAEPASPRAAPPRLRPSPARGDVGRRADDGASDADRRCGGEIETVSGSTIGLLRDS